MDYLFRGGRSLSCRLIVGQTGLVIVNIGQNLKTTGFQKVESLFETGDLPVWCYVHYDLDVDVHSYHHHHHHPRSDLHVWFVSGTRSMVENLLKQPDRRPPQDKPRTFKVGNVDNYDDYSPQPLIFFVCILLVSLSAWSQGHSAPLKDCYEYA